MLDRATRLVFEAVEQGRQAAAARGHDMGQAHVSDGGQLYAECGRCGARLTVTDASQPGQPAYSGAAVTQPCVKRHWTPPTLTTWRRHSTQRGVNREKQSWTDTPGARSADPR